MTKSLREGKSRKAFSAAHFVPLFVGTPEYKVLSPEGKILALTINMELAHGIVQALNETYPAPVLSTGMTEMVKDFGILGEQEVTVWYNYSAGRPGVHTLSNGDPGYPDEPAELEVVKAVINVGTGDIDLTEVLAENDDFMTELGEKVTEIEITDREADRADYENDQARERAFDAEWERTK